LREGPLRAGRIVDRILAGDLPVRAQIEELDGRRGTAEALRSRTVVQATAALGFAGLMQLGSAPHTLGLNVFTVAAVLFAFGLAGLMHTLRRLT